MAKLFFKPPLEDDLLEGTRGSDATEQAFNRSISFALRFMRKKFRAYKDGDEIMIIIEAAIWNLKGSRLLSIVYLFGYWIGRIQGYIEGRIMVRRMKSARHLIKRPPGSRLNVLVKFLYSQKSYKKIFGPTISDMQEEYFEALLAQCIWKARWVRVRGYYSLWKAVLFHAPVTSIKTIVKIWTTAG